MIFDDWKSIIHLSLGFTVCLAGRLSILFASILTAVFLLYECLESKTVGELLSDVAEFLTGVVLCCLILYLCRFDPHRLLRPRTG
jgi:hypothetical protein